MDNKIVINLLTGFLGSGKTTVLRRLLELPELTDTAVLINEFGDVGLDHLLLEKVDEDILLLDSGCICCSIRGDLKEAILRLHARMQRGALPPFSRMVIETTGLADPAPIVSTISVDPILRNHFAVGNVITVLDGLHGIDNLSRHKEANKQVAVADRLLVTKVDVAGEVNVQLLRKRLDELNPVAKYSEIGLASPVEESLITYTIGNSQTRLAEVNHWLQSVDGSEHNYHGSHEHFRSCCITRDAPIDWAVFGLWLSMLLNRHGRYILRVKGILNLIGSDKPVVIHGVQHTIHEPLHLSAWPQRCHQSRIIFILNGLDPDLLDQSFRAFCSISGRSWN